MLSASSELKMETKQTDLIADVCLSAVCEHDSGSKRLFDPLTLLLFLLPLNFRSLLHNISNFASMNFTYDMYNQIIKRYDATD